MLSASTTGSVTFNSLVKSTDQNYVQKIGKTCIISALIVLNESGTFTLYVNNTIGTIPSQFRPAATIRTSVTLRNGVYAVISIYASGNIDIVPYGTITGGTNLGLGFVMAYFTA